MASSFVGMVWMFKNTKVKTLVGQGEDAFGETWECVNECGDVVMKVNL